VGRGPSDALRQQLEPHRASDHWFAALSNARVLQRDQVDSADDRILAKVRRLGPLER